MEINNNTFIDVAPIIKNNRDIVRNLILEYRKNESNKFVLFDKEFKFENDGVTYYKVSIGAASNRLLYHYYYYENGRKNKYYDWDIEEKFNYQVENKLLQHIYEKLINLI